MPAALEESGHVGIPQQEAMCPWNLANLISKCNRLLASASLTEWADRPLTCTSNVWQAISEVLAEMFGVAFPDKVYILAKSDSEYGVLETPKSLC